MVKVDQDLNKLHKVRAFSRARKEWREVGGTLLPVAIRGPRLRERPPVFSTWHLPFPQLVVERGLVSGSPLLGTFQRPGLRNVAMSTAEKAGKP